MFLNSWLNWRWTKRNLKEGEIEEQMIKGYRKIRCFRWCVRGSDHHSDIFRNIKAIRPIFRSVRFYRVSRFTHRYRDCVKALSSFAHIP